MTCVFNHENIVTLYAMVFEPHHYGVVVEFVPLCDLKQFINRYQVFLCNVILLYLLSIALPSSPVGCRRGA